MSRLSSYHESLPSETATLPFSQPLSFPRYALKQTPSLATSVPSIFSMPTFCSRKIYSSQDAASRAQVEPKSIQS